MHNFTEPRVDRPYFLWIPKTGGTSLTHHLGSKIASNLHWIPDPQPFFVFSVFRNPVDRAYSLYKMYKEYPEDCPFEFRTQEEFFEKGWDESRKGIRYWLGSPQVDWLWTCPPDLILRFENLNEHFPGILHLRRGIPADPLSQDSMDIIKEAYKHDFTYHKPQQPVEPLVQENEA